MSRLWYRHPAKEWEEALPIGNGRLGAMVFGGIHAERIQVNEESMWYGGKVNRINPDFQKNLPNIRSLLAEGRIAEAERLMDRAMSGCPDGMHPYQTLGDINIQFTDMRGEPVDDSYVRWLDLDNAETVTSFQIGATVYERQILASKPADCILMRFTAEGPEKVNFSVRLRRWCYFDGVRQWGDDGICLYGNLGRGGYEFAMALRARVVGEGIVRTVGECLEVEGAKEVLLYFTADTTYHYSDGELTEVTRKACEEAGEITFAQRERLCQEALQTFLQERLSERFDKVMGRKYKALLAEHLRDYQSLYQRFAFELEDAQEFDAFPTDKRLERAKNGRADVGLGKLLFDFGRYLSISCSREGGLPATLQGLWNKDFNPPWDSKYTININAEMNYWHVESCNLSECHMPLLELITKVQKNGRVTAREMYGCRGFVAHHNTDIHGDSAPQDIWYPGSYWPMGAAWLCTHLWMHYQYTRDMDFLKKAFPVMAESALFFVDFLIERDGYLVTSPSVSPENTYRLPNGQTGSCCEGPTMDNQILRHLFGGCLEAWKELGQTAYEGCEIPGVEDIAGLMQEIADCRDRLHPTKISSSGRIMEWPEDFEEVEPGHRHISHLYGLYPAGEITMDGTPDLAAAAARTLEYRLSHGGGHTGWSRAWIMNHYASLWDGETAYQNIEAMLGQSTYPNLFDKHPPFQIDGNFGACAAMCGMLAQSNEERCVLLPALPGAWKTGCVRGLRLVGNAELSMGWQDGRLTEAVIQADSDYDTIVMYHGEKKRVTLKAGTSCIVSF